MVKHNFQWWISAHIARSPHPLLSSKSGLALRGLTSHTGRATLVCMYVYMYVRKYRYVHVNSIDCTSLNSFFVANAQVLIWQVLTIYRGSEFCYFLRHGILCCDVHTCSMFFTDFSLPSSDQTTVEDTSCKDISK